MNQPARKTGERAWDILIKAMVPISFILAGTLVAHEVRLSVIESNRFTPEDGRALERSFGERYDALNADIAEIKGDLRVIRQILEKDKR